MLIEVIEFSLIQFCYITNKNKFTLNRNGVVPLFKDIYNRIFGPTLPGKVYFKEKKYVLTYPGIAFLFPLSDDILDEFQTELELATEEKERLIVVLSKSSFRCGSVIIFDNKAISGNHGSYNNISWDKYFTELSKSLFVPLHNSTEFKKQKLLSFKNDNFSDLLQLSSAIKRKKNYISISVVDINLVKGLIRFNFSYHYRNFKYFVLELNKTKQQNVLYYLGEPDSTYLKIDSRFKIYSNGSNNTVLGSSNELDPSRTRESNTAASVDNSEFNEVFHNYFRYGFDILYSTDNQYGSTAKKIIFHNNIPTSLYFNKYNKVNWLMKGYGNSVGPADLENGYGHESSKSASAAPVHENENGNGDGDCDDNSNDYFPHFAKKVNKTSESWDWTDSYSESNLATSEMYFHEINEINFKTFSSENNTTHRPFDPSNFVLIDRNNLLSLEDDSDPIDLISDDEDFSSIDSMHENGHIANNGTASVAVAASASEAETVLDSAEEGSTRRKSSHNGKFKSTQGCTLKWGQSKLYGFKRCIWEVLSDNDAVSSITLF